MRSSRRGLSLLEALFGMLISFMVLGAVTFVLQQSVATGGSLDEQGTLAEVSHAFSLLRRDLAGAFQVTEPSGSPLERVVLQLVDPELAFASRVSDGDPFEASEQIEIAYRWVDRVLTRTVKRAGTVVDTQRVLTCDTFEASRNLSLIQIRVSIVQKRVTKSFQLECRIR